MKNLYIGVIVPLSVLIPLTIACIRFKLLRHEDKIMLCYLLCSGLANLIAKIFAINRINNFPLLHVYTVVEFATLAYFYCRVLGIEMKVMWTMQITFLLLCIINAMFLQSIYSFNTYALSVQRLAILLFAINYFAKLFVSLGEKNTDKPGFWYNSGVFIYFSGSFIYYLFSNYVNNASRGWNLIINLHAGFLMVLYILFATGFVKCRK